MVSRFVAVAISSRRVTMPQTRRVGLQAAAEEEQEEAEAAEAVEVEAAAAAVAA